MLSSCMEPARPLSVARRAVWPRAGELSCLSPGCLSVLFNWLFILTHSCAFCNFPMRRSPPQQRAFATVLATHLKVFAPSPVRICRWVLSRSARSTISEESPDPWILPAEELKGVSAAAAAPALAGTSFCWRCVGRFPAHARLFCSAPVAAAPAAVHTPAVVAAPSSRSAKTGTQHVTKSHNASVHAPQTPPCCFACRQHTPLFPCFCRCCGGRVCVSHQGSQYARWPAGCQTSNRCSSINWQKAHAAEADPPERARAQAGVCTCYSRALWCHHFLNRFLFCVHSRVAASSSVAFYMCSRVSLRLPSLPACPQPECGAVFALLMQAAAVAAAAVATEKKKTQPQKQAGAAGKSTPPAAASESKRFETKKEAKGACVPVVPFLACVLSSFVLPTAACSAYGPPSGSHLPVLSVQCASVVLSACACSAYAHSFECLCSRPTIVAYVLHTRSRRLACSDCVAVCRTQKDARRQRR